ncbi:extracellular solute-binding protein [Actinoalloteichus hymeniacidonis]|uniref:ABC-type sugar transport system, periplasmic component n=1 Tax=Actinoalloteichus hymeniacidonis TaxID=340345 RepID=A0AAC9HL67_9PSEU|nr:extracellular solute-binding protein [Actinoalloteichus hymeniacidonis]AOS61264.1 ABC-type sugar transport system, periplasmic component [Actinoalloteichus hymeniacidonis]MBB5910733.1 N,N'-diacetylchitobiose transport system substrate-binding protein [Actinoalloteichus hymeniacidonis]
MKRWTRVAAGAASVALLATGCAGTGGGGGTGDAETLTVWTMDGSLTDEHATALHAEFEEQTGVRVEHVVQQWNGVQDLLTTALASNNPPDVIELGNTQHPSFSAEGVLLDLTDWKDDLAGDQWLAGLAESAEYEGAVYGVPLLAANRVVAYRTDLFEQADVEPPTSWDEWITAIEALEETHGDSGEFQSLYLPGQSWYALLSMIWDNGGEIATESDGTWTGALDSPEARAGIEAYRELVETSDTSAAKDTDEAEPQQFEVFAGGEVAQMISVPWEVASAIEAAPELAENVSAFPIPSIDGGPAPVFLGGQNLAVPIGSDSPELAKTYLELFTSPEYQALIAENGAVPGASTDTSALDENPITAAMAEASAAGRAVPTSPNWAAVEVQNPIKEMLTAYLTDAASLEDASESASTALTDTLSG